MVEDAPHITGFAARFAINNLQYSSGVSQKIANMYLQHLFITKNQKRKIVEG